TTWNQSSNLMIGYINGGQVGSTNCGPNPINTTGLPQLRIGAEGWSGAPYQWNLTGRVDEVRISKTARSPTWIATEYANQNTPSTFAYPGSQESYTCGGYGPYYVQSRGQSYSSVSQAQITLPASTTAGNLLVFSFALTPQTVTSNGVTDTKSNTYNAAQMTTVGNYRVYTYNVPNAIGGSGPITATLALSGPATTLNISFLEYGGIATASPVDKTISGSGSGTAMNSGSQDTTQAVELLYGFGAGDYSCQASSPLYNRDLANGRCAMDRTVSATGTYSVTATQSQSGNWALQMVTFKGA
ncbi:MAG: LamG-like jellyroll fold domain-containing protein, partial [Methanomicrobiales archaeon]